MLGYDNRRVDMRNINWISEIKHYERIARGAKIKTQGVGRMILANEI